MNEKYSKEEILGEAVYSKLYNDNTVNSNDVREIRYYVTDNDNIFYGNPFNIEGIGFPCVAIETNSILSNELLPTGEYELRITCAVKTTIESPQTILKRMAARVDVLFDNKPNIINGAISASKKIRCRRIYKINSPEQLDDTKKIYRKTNIYFVQLDDEIIN